MSAACEGLADLFLSDRPADMVRCVEVCDGCTARLDCTRNALEEIWCDDDGPHAWFVRGGLLPYELEDLWRASAGGRLAGIVADAVAA